MKARIEVVKSNMEVFHNLTLADAVVRHVEFDKLVVQSADLEFELWHRNIVIEEASLRINGFVLYNGLMGRIECLATPTF